MNEIFDFLRAAFPYICVAVYLALGFDVFRDCIRSLRKGKAFDESALMTVATLGALALGEYAEAAAVMLLFRIGEYLEHRASHKARSDVNALLAIRPDTANVLRGSDYVTVHPSEVAVGETILVKPGERVPLDAVVLTGETALDASMLTGESVPRAVSVGGEILSGCVNTGGVVTAKTLRLYGESTASKIVALVESAAEKKAPAEKFVTRFARVYTPAVTVFALLLAFVPPLLFGAELRVWVHRALSFLVVSCPCALVISVPLGYFAGLGRASGRGILIKGANYLDALANPETVVFDKTGTLTLGAFEVADVAAVGFAPDEVLSLAACAERYSTHPIARAIAVSAPERVVTDVTERAGRGVSANVDGVRVLVGGENWLREHGVEPKPGASGTSVCVAADGQFAGRIMLRDKTRPDAKRAVSALHSLGARVVMLTGDAESAARNAAETLGIREYRAELLPQDKVTAVESLLTEKRRGGTLVFVGDGINDAPVLARADIGFAMGGLGSDAAVEAADAVLMTDEPSLIAEAVRISRRTRLIIKQNIALSLGIKAAVLLLLALGVTEMWGAVFADVGVTLLAVLNSTRVGRK